MSTSTGQAACLGRQGPPLGAWWKSVDHQDSCRAAWSFDELEPYSRQFELGAARRTDPYYDIEWGYPATLNWIPSNRAHVAFSTRPSRHMKSLDQEQALAHLLDAGRRTTRHTLDVHSALLGAVHGWKTCTSEQAAAITGRRDFWNGGSLPYANLTASGLIDLGTLVGGFRGPRIFAAPASREVHRVLLKELGLRQLLEITGGEGWARGPAGFRHNVLATELGLRAAEYAENVAAVLPESYSRLHALAGPERPSVYPRSKGSRRAADLTLVRTDGLKIAIELTASRGANLKDKIEAYARLFAGGVHGLVVIFVTAPSTDPDAPAPGKVGGLVRRLIEEAVLDFSGSSFDRAAHRFGVATWADWFPGPGRVSEDFFAMTAERPSVQRGWAWTSASFGNASSVALDPEGLGHVHVAEAGWLRVAEFARLLGSTPHWWRTDLHPEALRELSGHVLGATTGTLSIRDAMFGSSRAAGAPTADSGPSVPL